MFNFFNFETRFNNQVCWKPRAWISHFAKYSWRESIDFFIEINIKKIYLLLALTFRRFQIRVVIDRFMDFRQKEKERLEQDESLTVGDVTTVNLTMVSVSIIQF